MSKNIKDYLHLYLGCEIWICRNIEGNDVVEKLTTKMLHEDEFMFDAEVIEFPYKPILRPLSDMTDGYFLSLFKISMGWFEDAEVSEYKRFASDDLYIRTGKGQYIFSFRKGFDSDVRVEQGISLYTRMFHISESLIVDESGIKNSEKYFTNEKLIVANNQSTIFNKLRKDGYDCDGLLESGLAIDKTKPHE